MSRLLVLVWKDLLAEFRSKEIVTPLIGFSLLIVVLFNYVFKPEVILSVSAGLLWVGLSFAGMLGLARTFILEKDYGCWEGLRLLPLSPEILFLGKLLSGFLFLFSVKVVFLPIFSILLNLPLFPLPLLPVLILTDIGFVSLGSLFSSLSVNTRAREVMLPLLFFPIILPLLIVSVRATELVLAGSSWSEIMGPLQFLIAIDIIFVMLSILLFPFTQEV